MHKKFKYTIIIILAFILYAFNDGKSNVTYQDHPLVKINGGTFMMGQNTGEGDEKPEHEVVLSDFYIGKYEVTVAEYNSFCNATNREMPKEPNWGWIDNHPIINTSWHDAMAFIKWLNGVTNENFRLPTEAEFEFVIRNGDKSGDYPWDGNQPLNENLADISYGKFNSSTRIWKNYDDSFPHTSPVGSFSPNKMGIHDINGNIWEWCNDWYGDYTNDKKINPKGPDMGTEKVGRGGSYNADPWHSRSASRSYVKPTFEGPGFRLAKSM